VKDHRSISRSSCALNAQLANHESVATLGVTFIELDLFKQVNDKFGHACWNDLLRIVARACSPDVLRADRAAQFRRVLESY
jgi:GGDEF domain-containing protein